jgi:hypothetical protein
VKIRAGTTFGSKVRAIIPATGLRAGAIQEVDTVTGESNALGTVRIHDLDFYLDCPNGVGGTMTVQFLSTRTPLPGTPTQPPSPGGPTFVHSGLGCNSAGYATDLTYIDATGAFHTYMPCYMPFTAFTTAHAAVTPVAAGPASVPDTTGPKTEAVNRPPPPRIWPLRGPTT